MSWTLIEAQTLGASAASVTLGSGGTIPQTYKTLKLICSIRTGNAGTASNAQVTFNSTSTGYAERLLYGNGASAASATSASGSTLGWTNLATGNNGTANTFGNAEMTIPNYAGSTSKVITSDSVNENNSVSANDANQYLDAGLWSNTAAITSITLSNPNNFLTGCTFTLYGLK